MQRLERFLIAAEQVQGESDVAVQLRLVTHPLRLFGLLAGQGFVSRQHILVGLFRLIELSQAKMNVADALLGAGGFGLETLVVLVLLANRS